MVYFLIHEDENSIVKLYVESRRCWTMEQTKPNEGASVCFCTMFNIGKGYRKASDFTVSKFVDPTCCVDVKTFFNEEDARSYAKELTTHAFFDSRCVRTKILGFLGELSEIVERIRDGEK